jgi:hypothetical protein
MPGSYRLIFTSSDGITTTDDFTAVVPAVPRLTFDCGQPQNGLVNKPLNTVSVWVKNAQGAIDTAFVGEVGLSLGRNPGNTHLGQQGGNLMALVVNGIATFPKLFLDKPGQGYTLVATCTHGETAERNGFNIGSG